MATTDEGQTSAPTPLDEQLWQRMREKLVTPEAPFTSAERHALRLMLRDWENKGWLWKKVRTLTPWIFSVISAAAAAWAFLTGKKP